MTKKLKYGIKDGFDLVYEERVVAFLDILGFSQMVMQRQDDDVDFIVNLIPDMLKTHQGMSLREDLEVTRISDSIILSLNTNKNDKRLSSLFQLSVFIGRVQHELALNGYYMRGGISVGPLFHRSKQNLLIGPAFISAYNLESKYSIVPRVIIDNSLKDFYQITEQEIVKSLNTDFTNFYYYGNLVKFTETNSRLYLNEYDLFIDYVSPILGRLKNGFTWDPTNFLNHLHKALLSSKAYDKYLWLSKYAIEVFLSEYDMLEPAAQQHLDDIQKILGN